MPIGLYELKVAAPSRAACLIIAALVFDVRGGIACAG
jgi:hypothetical protein